jgi:CheY-like chemotaxis protein
VDLAENGIDACALAAATDYDLILMDCHMPEMDGFEATLTIRAHESGLRGSGGEGRHTPIVALTASVLKEDRDRCFASGMDDFVSKPFRPDQLRTMLERWAVGRESSERPAREAA